MSGFWGLNRYGEEVLYRDQRKFVMNLSKGYVERNGEKLERYILTTYENIFLKDRRVQSSSLILPGNHDRATFP
jgi:hypothetical protein